MSKERQNNITVILIRNSTNYSTKTRSRFLGILHYVKSLRIRHFEDIFVRRSSVIQST